MKKYYIKVVYEEDISPLECEYTSKEIRDDQYNAAVVQLNGDRQFISLSSDKTEVLCKRSKILELSAYEDIEADNTVRFGG